MKWIKAYAITITLVGLFFAAKRIWFQQTVANKEPPALWQMKRNLYNSLPVDSGKIVFIGDSHIERSPFAEVFHGLNRGIGSEPLRDLLKRMPDVLAMHPGAIFVCTGANDIQIMPVGEIERNFDSLVRACKGIPLYISAILPVNEHYPGAGSINENTREINEYLSREHGYIFLEPVALLPDELTYDNVHLNAAGYRIWIEGIRKVLK